MTQEQLDALALAVAESIESRRVVGVVVLVGEDPEGNQILGVASTALDLHNLKGILRYAEESLVDLELN